MVKYVNDEWEHGWLHRQLQRASAEVATWPPGYRRAMGAADGLRGVSIEVLELALEMLAARRREIEDEIRRRKHAGQDYDPSGT